MIIERTLDQLRGTPRSPECAKEMGQLGYLQWLGSLPCSADYEREAVRAYLAATPYRDTDPAVAVFCTLVGQSLRYPLQPLDLTFPKPRRRGGARRRRQWS